MKNHLLQLRTVSVLAASLLTAQLALADSELWIGNPGVTTTTNWSDSANWSGTTKGPGGNTVFFGNGVAVAPGLINNVVNISTNCYALCYTNSTGANTTFIANGVTLTNTGNNSGPALLFTPNADTSNTNAITGASGTLLISGSSAGGITVTTTNGGSTGTHPLLDLSGLGTLIISNAGSSAAINVANSGVKPGGQLNLAMTNYISLPATGTGGSAAIVVGEATSNNSSSPGGVLYLGITNAIFAGNIGVGLSKQSAATLAFNPAFLANNPVAYVRGPGGSAVTNWAIGDGINTSGTSTGPGGTVNFNGGTVNAVVSTMWLGKPSQTSATAPTAKGTLSFSAGTLSVVNLTNGWALTPTTGGPGAATGTINVTGTGLLSVSNLVMAYLGTGNTSSTGTLNITNGAVQANTITAGGGSSTISMVGGTLTVTNTAGTGAQPLSTLSVSNSTLTLPAYSSSASAAATTLTVLTQGTNDTLNISVVPPTAAFPAQYPVISFTTANYYSPDFTLGSLPAPYQGYISNNTASIDLVITNSSSKTDTWNGNHNGNWDVSTLNWLYLGSPVYYLQGDLVTFDDSLHGTANVVLATNVSPSAIGFNNSQTNYVLSGTNKITGATGLTLGDNNGSVTLTESGGDNFSGGITVNSGTLILDNPNSAILGGLEINGGTVQIGNNDANGALPGGAVTDDGALVFDLTNNVTVATAIAGTGTLTQNGSGTLTLTGANAYTGSTTVGKGTLALSGSGTLSNSAAVSVNGATFDVSALSQPTTLVGLTLSNANVNVAPNASASANIACSGLTFAGTTNRINVVSLPPLASYPVTFTIIQSASTASGAFNVGVGSLPAATPPYVATVTQSADQTAVLLTVTTGPVGVRASVLWTGADAGVPDLNWSDRLNWQLPGAPGAGDNVIFNPTDAQGASALSPPGGGASALQSSYLNNIVDTNFTIASLTFTNVNGSYHNTLISNGLTLSITNALTVGSGSQDFGGGATEFVTIAGTNGTLSVNNTSGTIYVGLGSSTAGAHQATLDLSALGTFTASISRLVLGAGSSSVGFGLGRESAVVYLAQTNTITASLAVSGTETSDTSAAAVALDIGDNDGNSGDTCYLYLGQTNAIFAGAICTARQKQSAQMVFNPAFTAITLPVAWFRGADGVSAVGTWSLGDGVAQTGSEGSTGVNDFTGGTVNALVNAMYIGRAATDTANNDAGTSTGTLTFDDGVINVGTLYLGYQPTNTAKVGQGTMNVSSNATAGAGATLVVTGNLNLGLSSGGTGAASTTGTLNLTNGTVLANAIVPGTNSTINLAGGWLALTNPVGTVAAPLGTLTLASLGTPDNSATLLSLPVGTNGAGITVGTLNIDGLSSTTNIINIESVGPVGATPVELVLIKYGTLNPGGGIFNVGLGKLPSGYSGYLTNDTTIDSAIALVLTTALHPRPAITAFSVQAATNLVISGANGFANLPYAVLTSTNAAAPLATWTSIANGIFGSNGSFNFTVPVNTAMPQQFFRVQVQ
jgi:autotransporter-associated beta strand protein